MEEKINEIEDLFHQAVDYSKTSFEIIKLKAVDKAADVASTAIVRVIYLVITAIGFIVLSMGISYWLGDILGKIYFGFLIVSGFWFIAGIFIYLIFNKRIKKLLRNSIIGKALHSS